MQTFRNEASGDVILAVADEVVANKAYLSEIDGKIGDGDHGVNMAKGFSMAADRIRGKSVSFSAALDTLGSVLMTEIGGSMGPLYGVMFTEFSEAIEGKAEIDARSYATMLAKGLDGVQSIGAAKVGDKTLLDTLVPAIAGFNAALDAGKPFAEALDALVVAAEKGRDSTKDMMARIGRASRLGERSIGVLDAGATSCALILKAMALTVKTKLSA